MRLLALLLSLTFLVITHEFGHFCFARLFKTRVRRFYVFFNPKFSILKAKKFDGKWHFLWFNANTPAEWEEKDPDNTIWGLGWIPLGGYCDIAGMIDETKTADDLESEPQPWEYRSKKAWQRLCIISGGVLVNFISALIIYAAIFAHWGQDELPMQNATLGYNYNEILISEGLQNGDMIMAIDGTPMNDLAETQKKLLLDNPKNISILRNDSLITLQLSGNLLNKVSKENPSWLLEPRLPFIVDGFVAGSVAEKAGMKVGDKVVTINGKKADTYSDISVILDKNKEKELLIGFYRNDSLVELPVTPDKNGKLGVQLNTRINEFFKVQHLDYNIFEAIPVGIKYGCQTLVTYVSSLKILFTKDGASNLGGFGTIASVFPTEWDWFRFWNMTAFLAIILAFMNIIPIPGLDGGHIVFTIWEMITRRKPSEKFLERAQTVGLILLLILLVWANGNDLIRWISGKF